MRMHYVEELEGYIMGLRKEYTLGDTSWMGKWAETVGLSSGLG